MRILIVEDDRTTARALEALLTSWNHVVMIAPDGRSALKAFDATPAPELVLLDWLLPDMDGLDVCQQIRALGGPIPAHLILLTSRNARADIVAGLEGGADEYLVKPVDVDELRARLRAGERLIGLQQGLADRVLQLERALERVQTLSGLLPICAYCHSIRDDSNYWHRVEEYISTHTAAKFSHGICPKCLPRVAREMGVAPASK
jgi:DNA-binding response OmpR family regulator